MSLNNQNVTTEIGRDKTAVLVLTLIRGTGMLVALFVFIFVENISSRYRQTKLCLCNLRCLNMVLKLLQHAARFVIRLNAEVENAIKINSRPQVSTNMYSLRLRV